VAPAEARDAELEQVATPSVARTAVPVAVMCAPEAARQKAAGCGAEALRAAARSELRPCLRACCQERGLCCARPERRSLSREPVMECLCSQAQTVPAPGHCR
jgi:hypothetical protein